MSAPHISCSIDLGADGHCIWGEGLFVWAVYKIDVTYGDEGTWSIYRRFAHFTNLLEQLKAFVGEEILRPYMSIINLNPDETPPQDKIYQNTVLAIPVDISISQRKPMLNRFLEEILQNPSITKQHIFLEFIDQPRKGIPGCVRILKQSGEEILWQKMTNTNKPTFMMDFYPLWSIKYLLVTKKGMLYLFTTMYDPIEKAEMLLDLKRPSNVLVEDLTMHLKVGEGRISFVLESREEIAEWTKIMTTFSIKSTTGDVPPIGLGSPMQENPMGVGKAKVGLLQPTKEDVTEGYGL